MGGSAECYSDLQDPRTGNATRHLLLEVPMIALCAMLCGAEGCVDTGAFVKANSLTSPAMFASLRRKTQTSLGRLRLVIHANGTTGSKSALGQEETWARQDPLPTKPCFMRARPGSRIFRLCRTGSIPINMKPP